MNKYRDLRIDVSLSGFIIQMQPVEDLRINIKRIVIAVLNSAAEVLEFRELAVDEQTFNPNEHDCFSWSDDYNPDLIEIIFKRDLSVASAWNLTYKLREIDKVIYAEPSFSLLIPYDRWPWTDIGDSSIPKEILKEIEREPEWHLNQMEVRDAWKLFKKQGRKPGEGIKIALPDTGFLPHPEIDLGSSLCKQNFEQDISRLLEQDKLKIPAEEILEEYSKSGVPVTFWHGTATASLIFSPEGRSDIKGDTSLFVTGVAPYAAHILYSLGPNTLKKHSDFFSPRLAKAINEFAKQADNENIRVISISFGGHPTLALRRAIINAQRKGIIVVAAAGNLVPFTTWPSTYANVVSVASSDFSGAKIAPTSSIGRRVDVAAPGEYVLVATPKLVNQRLTYSVEPRSGTSYSAPLVAGVAALWLSYHGWDNLAKKYGVSRIPLVFDKLLRETCKTRLNWDTTFWGAGIVNAHKLLEAELPKEDDPYIQESLAYREADHIRLDRGGAKTFIHLFEQTLLDSSFLEGISTQILGDLGFSSALNRLTFNILSKKANRSNLAREINLDIAWWTISEILGRSGKNLRQYLRTFGQEITFYLATNPKLYEQMENLLKRKAGLPIKGQESLLVKAMYSEETLIQSALIKFIEALKDIASDYLRQSLEEYLKSLKSSQDSSIGEFSAKRLMDM